MSQQYGYANLTVQNQNPNNIQGAEACILEQSACQVNAAFFDTTAVAFIPSQLRYRIDDVGSGAVIANWSGIAPAATVQLIVTSQQNQMISQTAESECHQVTLQITDVTGNVYYATVSYSVRAAVGI